MAPRNEPVPVTTTGGAGASTVAFRSGNGLFVTVVVKATFAFVGDAAMVPTVPDAIVPDDDELGLRTAGDLAPFLPQADVLLVGSVRGSFPPPYAVRLGVFRNATALVDKSVSLSSPLLAPFGPLPRRSIAQLGLHGALALGERGPLPVIPEAFDWSSFQAAPPDQRVPSLDGSEWVVLAGVDGKGSVLRSQLPRVVAVASLTDSSDVARPPSVYRLSMACDCLIVDTGRWCCSLLWRGTLAVPLEGALGQMRAFATIEPSSAAAQHLPTPGGMARPKSSPPPPVSHGTETQPPVTLIGGLPGESDAQGRLVLPFAARPASSPPPPAVPNPAAAARIGTPWAMNPAQGSAPPRHAFVVPPEPSPGRVPLTGTLEVSPEMIRRLVVPFGTPSPGNVPPPVAPPPPPTRSGTLALDAVEIRRAQRRPATPFENPPAQTLPAPSPPPPPMIPEPPIAAPPVALPPPVVLPPSPLPVEPPTPPPLLTPAERPPGNLPAGAPPAPAPAPAVEAPPQAAPPATPPPPPPGDEKRLSPTERLAARRKSRGADG